MPSIYTITHVASGRCYVGSSINHIRRFRQHISELNKGRHIAERLQNAWNKYGQDAFAFEVIDTCTDEGRIACEQFHIDRLRPFYNWALCVPASVDRKVAQKISAALLGNQHTKGLKWSDEARANMSKAVKGKPRSPAQRAAMLKSLELARQKNRVNKPGMNWRKLREKEKQCESPP